MGNESSRVEKFTDSRLTRFEDYTRLREDESHCLFGRCSLLAQKKNPNCQVLSKSLCIQDSAHLRTIQEQLEQRMILTHPNLLKIYGYSLSKQSVLCSSQNKCQAYCEYHSVSLQQETSNRQNLEKRYDPSELWMVAKSLISCLQYLEMNGYFDQRVSSEVVFLSSTGEVKIADRSFEELFMETSRFMKPSWSGFDIGIVLLEMCLLQDCSYVLSIDGHIDEKSLEFLIDQLPKQDLGDAFIGLLKKLLSKEGCQNKNITALIDMANIFPIPKSSSSRSRSSRGSQPSQGLSARNNRLSEDMQFQSPSSLHCFRINSSFMNNLANNQSKNSSISQSNPNPQQQQLNKPEHQGYQQQKQTQQNKKSDYLITEKLPEQEISDLNEQQNIKTINCNVNNNMNTNDLISFRCTPTKQCGSFGFQQLQQEASSKLLFSYLDNDTVRKDRITRKYNYQDHDYTEDDNQSNDESSEDVCTNNNNNDNDNNNENVNKDKIEKVINSPQKLQQNVPKIQQTKHSTVDITRAAQSLNSNISSQPLSKNSLFTKSSNSQKQHLSPFQISFKYSSNQSSQSLISSNSQSMMQGIDNKNNVKISDKMVNRTFKKENQSPNHNLSSNNTSISNSNHSNKSFEGSSISNKLRVSSSQTCSFSAMKRKSIQRNGFRAAKDQQSKPCS